MDKPLPTLEDFYDTILCSNNSAPGPDGLSFHCLRRTYKIIGKIAYQMFIQMIEFDQHNKELINNLEDINGSLLYVLSKVMNVVPHLDQLRPISVPDTLNRIISSTVLKFMLPYFDEIIPTTQQAVFRKRNIKNNVKWAFDGFFEAKQQDSHSFLYFIDFKKAFDSLDRNYLIQLLNSSEVPRYW